MHESMIIFLFFGGTVTNKIQVFFAKGNRKRRENTGKFEKTLSYLTFRYRLKLPSKIIRSRQTNLLNLNLRFFSQNYYFYY